MKDTLILAIESSCDDTAAAVVKNGRTILSNVIASQTELHNKFGGVVPEISSRQHTKAIVAVVAKALLDANVAFADLSAIAVTYGPGLVGALLVGLSYAKALAYSLQIPLLPVHHIKGHICANYIEQPDLAPPFVCLVASGGHSHIVLATDHNQFQVLGKTRDDAAGEAFDKIARVLGLGYPGGPLIDNLAKEGSACIDFPQTNFKDSLDFSFSGVKTAVINYLHRADMKGEPINQADIAASFQHAVVSALCKNTIRAAQTNDVKTICLAGGVASNSHLRSEMKRLCEDQGLTLHYPSPILCTDNAAMISCCGYFEYLGGNIADLSLNAMPSLSIS